MRRSGLDRLAQLAIAITSNARQQACSNASLRHLTSTQWPQPPAGCLQTLHSQLRPMDSSSCHNIRFYSSKLDDPETSKKVEEINDLFVTARDEIDFAKEEAETVYFNESIAEARRAVDACLQQWTTLLSQLDEPDRGKLQRSMGMKMEQLKAEFDEVASLHLE